jgi:two-component system, sensor histidine kinase
MSLPTFIDGALPPAPKRILVVEDVVINQEIVSSMLQVLGHQSFIVDNGAAALDLLHSEVFDLVLMDWHMPDMDGLDVTRGLRQRESAGGVVRTPVVIVSASAVDREVATCLAAGADDHLAKPFRLNDLKAIVARWTHSR